MDIQTRERSIAPPATAVSALSILFPHTPSEVLSQNRIAMLPDRARAAAPRARLQMFHGPTRTDRPSLVTPSDQNRLSGAQSDRVRPFPRAAAIFREIRSVRPYGDQRFGVERNHGRAVSGRRCGGH